MPFGFHTHKKTVWVSAALVALVPLSALAVASPEVLAQTRDAFDQLWHSAAETTKRRATLEENLAQFDQKVATARQDLEKTANDQKAIQQKIIDRKKLIDVLQQQMDAVSESRGFYQAVALSQKDDIASFVRYLASKDIALHDAGPSAGGVALKRLLRGSLGDSIDRSLAELALIKTRERFSSQIDVLVSEAEKTEARLHDVMAQMSDQLGALQQQGQDLTAAVDQKAAFIDSSWRQKQLNEAELKDVAQETDEANAQMGAIQASLIKINTELREAKLQKLTVDLGELQTKIKTLQDQKTGYERKDEAMSLLEDAALKAFQVTVQLRNSDMKLYRRVQDDELKLQNLQIDYDKTVRSASGVVMTSADSDKILMQIQDLKSQLVLMKNGVPEDAAADYVRKKRQSDEATQVRKDIAIQILDLSPQISALQSAMNKKGTEIEAAQNDNGMNGLPTLFSWPVHGPITATYLDPDYVKVFKVPHRAIDIGVPFGTPIHTVSEGIVFKVKDGGATGYSYILIGHRDGYASLYGHVSKSFVKAGDVISYDQVIGLTGGTPGSHGAGPMTTGAHLHLEMTKDGEHFNPVDILQNR